jgi:ribosome-associated heat shock protein Hsp15
VSVRVDKWLWCVRVYKTRASANDACTNGRVRINDEAAKPASKVKVGDTITVRRKDRTVIVEVVQLLEKRVGAALVPDALIDKSPPVPTVAKSGDILLDTQVAQRDRGSGRPTKRDRRNIEKFRRGQ